MNKHANIVAFPLFTDCKSSLTFKLHVNQHLITLNKSTACFGILFQLEGVGAHQLNASSFRTKRQKC